MTVQNFTEYIGELAVKALKAEVSATPKPGLVDRDNSGAHCDMDYPLMIRSSDALFDCFTECAKAGADSRKLRQIGIRGEVSMFEATNHVNTHKGLIFSMGILCGALGELSRNAEGDGGSLVHRIDSSECIDRCCAGDVCSDSGNRTQTEAKFVEQDVQELCAELAAELLADDRLELERNPAVTGGATELPRTETHGAKVLRETGIRGIRGEALSGFSSAFNIGLPAIREAVNEGYELEPAMIRALFALMAHTEDSNLVHRGGEAGLRFVQEHAKAILMDGDLREARNLDLVRAFDEICIEKNLSPGGSADLLALSAMLYLFFERNEG